MDYEKIAKLMDSAPKRQTVLLETEVYLDSIIGAIISNHKELKFIEDLVMAVIHKNFVLAMGEKNEKFPNNDVLKKYQRNIDIFTEVMNTLKKLET